ncbi:hypothetical protein [Mycolicibacterium poriferae]|jgi:hypothetical protein|uniref:hypothetical protein n=1 Tax=Mycolicibacterium poriferae TaxID=39694 RepID=UPI0024BB493B|nr:hypothetical protein [Mycolicibacterium poriferae]
MILVEVKPRDDGRYDIYVSEDGEPYVNSSQGYENVEDAERIARKLFAGPAFSMGGEQITPPVTLRTKYRTGQTKTEQLR